MPTLKKGLDGRYYTRTNIDGDIVTLHFHPDIESYLERYSINIDSNLPDTWIYDTKKWVYTDNENSQYNGKESLCRIASCPVCGKDVFYYENIHGSKVYFDCLGFPWLKHPCTSVDRDMQINNYAAVLSKIERVFRMGGLTYCLLSNECKLYKIVFYGIIDICGKVFSSFVDDGVVINNRFYRIKNKSCIGNSWDAYKFILCENMGSQSIDGKKCYLLRSNCKIFVVYIPDLKKIEDVLLCNFSDDPNHVICNNKKLYCSILHRERLHGSDFVVKLDGIYKINYGMMTDILYQNINKCKIRRKNKSSRKLFR
ncbi:hypothetical protein [Desulfovibrio piger]|uniref:hypothetical protein n=1 Tax=Desulfovibrio piger TaxID=901 RepID=UPI0026EE2D4D|nr:hypothetical protein [Desulfovibrio piger]